MLTALALIMLVPLLAWMIYQRAMRMADDTENLIRNVIGGRPGDMEKRNETRVCAITDDRLYNSLIRHFGGLNAARKSLQVIAVNASPMGADAIVDAVNAMQKEEGKNTIPQPVMNLVLDSLQVGGLLVLRGGLYKVSTEGKLLNDLIRL